MNDIQGQGSINQFELGIVYAYQIEVTRELTVSAGLDATYVQRSMNTSDLVLEDMIDPRTGLVSNPTSDFLYEQNVAYPDFTVGFTTFYRNFYGGLSGAHLFRPGQSVSSDPNSRLARRMILFAGGMFPVYQRRLGREVLQVSPNLIYLQQKNYSQITYGVEGLIKDQIIAGLWLRQNLGIKFGALIFSAGYVTKNYRIRYSYDQQLSSPTVNLPALGSHELSLILTIDGQKKKKHRAIKCPKI